MRGRVHGVALASQFRFGRCCPCTTKAAACHRKSGPEDFFARIWRFAHRGPRKGLVLCTILITEIIISVRKSRLKRSMVNATFYLGIKTCLASAVYAVLKDSRV